MKDKKFVVNTKLNLVDYISLVDLLVDDYFDVEGNYQPHIGMANAMRLFYNLCVMQSKFDETLPHDFSDITLVDELASYEPFITAFNSALNCGYFDFSFGCAYNNAMEIVQQKINPMNKMSDGVNHFLNSLLLLISDVMTPENIGITRDIANDIKSGKLDFTKIMTAYGNSPEFEKILTSPKNVQGQDSQDNNIVPLHKE